MEWNSLESPGLNPALGPVLSFEKNVQNAGT